MDYDQVGNFFGPQDDRIGFYKRSLARARQLGRNVAHAMSVPIEEAEYRGEKSGVECPVCHSNILHVHEDLPYVLCPTCAVRGEIVIEDAKMKVRWSEEDAKTPRFSYEGIVHHMDWCGQHYGGQDAYFKTIAELTKKHKTYGTFLRPESRAVLAKEELQKK